ncbi:MAG TPA: Dabb family protein, partial [Streptosporangiaceae bacterium]
MMLRHVVLLGWKPEASEEQKQRVAAELGTLPSLIPAIRAYQFGPDAGINEGTYDFGIVADFDDAAAYRTYRDNP